MAEPGWIGKVLGQRYRLDSLLGQGGMSSVYKATDPNLKRSVAVKLIHSHLTGDPEFVRRFEAEASAVAQLHHRNIIQVYDFNRDHDTYYMVLEFVPGESLDKRLRRLAAEGRRMPAMQAATITAEVADALDYAHGMGIIHRDIKPANIMLGERGHAVLMDFGLAKIVGATQYTASGAVMGTASYIAPELVRGQPPSPGSDIYALGASLFEMLAGRPPFMGDSALSVMMKHLNEPPPDLRQLAPETPQALIRVVERALAKEPQQRFASARDMLAALEPVVPGTAESSAQGGGTARPVDVVQKGPAAAAPSATLMMADKPAPPIIQPPAKLAAPGPGQRGPAASAASAGTGVPAHHPSRVLWLAAGAVALLLCLTVAATGLVGGALVLPAMLTTPTALASPTDAAPTGTPEVLYQNDLSQESSDWPTQSAPAGSLSFDQGAYVLRDLNSDNLLLAPATVGEPGNIHVEVTAANTGQADDAGFGLICDYTDVLHYYYFGITESGEYAIMKRQPGHVTVLTDDRGQWVQSTNITLGEASYQVGVDCGADGKLALYADGRLVASATDKTFNGGAIGVFVQTGVGAPAEVQFKNLVVTSLH